MEFGDVSDIDELSMEEDGLVPRNQTWKRKRNNGRNIDNEGNNDNSGDDSRFKSKNLDAERRRRAKLNDRLLMLRTLVPIITNMTKATIIKDAITYIEQLSKEVDELILELEETQPKDDDTKPIITGKDEAEEMKACGIQPEVKVITIDENKIWVKVVFQKRKGGLTKLVEALTKLRLEFNDTNLTTSKGAAVINCCLEGVCGGRPDIEETKELIMSVITTLDYGHQ